MVRISLAKETSVYSATVIYLVQSFTCNHNKSLPGWYYLYFADKKTVAKKLCGSLNVIQPES